MLKLNYEDLIELDGRLYKIGKSFVGKARNGLKATLRNLNRDELNNIILEKDN